MATLSRASLDDVINHVFLPPKLPQSAESIPADSDLHLLKVTSAALRELALRLPTVAHGIALDRLASTFDSSSSAYGGPDVISASSLFSTLKKLAECASGGLIIHVHAQNAAVTITKTGDAALFEAFELSATNENVMSTAGRLVRAFPGCAVSVKTDVFRDPDFQITLANTLAKMSIQPVPGMQPQSRKDGEKHDEARDTTHPGIVTELLLAGFLRSVGTAASVVPILKHTRDDVLWKKAEGPWRRSPIWLLIRVTMQLALSRDFPDGNLLYKECVVYIHNFILKQAISQSLHSNMLYCMSAKIVRRLQKLPNQPPALMHAREEIQDTLSSSHNAMQQRMKSAQATKDLNLSKLSSLNFAQDVVMALPEIDEYIRMMQSRPSSSRPPSFDPPSRIVKYEPTELPSLASAAFDDSDYGIFNLQGFEQWVEKYLSTWISAELSVDADGSQCSRLKVLMKQYHDHASRQYRGNPEGSSIMLLTMVELWAACDMAATACCKLLRRYSTSAPHKILHNLLLPRKSHMNRLRDVETYMISRSEPTLIPITTLFSCSRADSFAAQYYDSSPEHKKTLAAIEAKAARERKEKLAELERQKQEYRRLMDLHESVAGCEYVEECVDRLNDDWKTVHKPGCQKCSYSASAKALKIKVHEWPLPSDTTKAKAVVFELQLPEWFAHWRDALMYLLMDVFKGDYVADGPRTSYALAQHKQLSGYYVHGFSRRMDLLSENKPYVVTHYGTKDVGKTNKTEVCGPNGCDYRYFDTALDRFFTPCDFRGKTESMCTYQLPGHMAAAQKYMFRPAASPSGPDANVILASLHECPQSMTVEEYRDLCTLPLGHPIQWQNMLEQIGMATVDFRKPETLLVLFQCIYQSGPPSGGDLRESHEVLSDITFAAALVQNLESTLERIKENWESSHALCVFTAMASRVLSASDCPKIQKSCVEFLHKARVVSFGWLHILRHKAQQAIDQVDRTLFVAKATQVALICGITFDIDPSYLVIVMEANSNASILWQCSMAFREGRNTAPSKLDSLLTLRFQSVLHRCHSMTSPPGRAGLDDAVSGSWSAYTPCEPWHRLGNGAEYWMSTITTGGGTGAEMKVHFNTLTGELLVDGVPVGGAPRDYENKALFKTLFGHAAIEVMPTTLSGMQYSVKKAVEGSNIFLGLGHDPHSQGKDLLVQAHVDGKVFETIPSRLFRGKFPRSFTDGFVHWYDTSSGTIHFRPIEQALMSVSSAIWTLADTNGKWRLGKNGTTLIAMSSATSKSMGVVFASLTVLDRIHCLLDSAGTELRVELHLPSVKLGFSIARGTTTLRSREYRGMLVDESQSVGTFLGLENKLMLKHFKTGSRSVIVPQGTVLYDKAGQHVRVRVDPESTVKVHLLVVDKSLGRLIDNGSLDCRLYVAYLHALTSYCLPDFLTHKTGTEQAITILQSAAVRSFDQLTQAQVDLLTLISKLSPGREYYPPHKRSMQTLDWDANIGFLSQHPALQEAVQTIFAQWDRLKIFFPESSVQVPRPPKINVQLLHRDRIRTATFRVSMFGAEYHTTVEDAMYSGRDQDQESQRASDAFIMAKRVGSGSDTLHWESTTASGLWATFQKQNYIFGPEHAVAWSELRYDADWTEDNETWICQNFTALHKVLSDQAACRPHTFDLVMWLSTMAWSDLERPLLQLVGLLLIQGSNIPLTIGPDSSGTLQPVRGNMLDDYELRREVNANKRALHECPEFQIARAANQTKTAHTNQRRQKYDSNISKNASRFVDAIQMQWRCEIPSAPDIADVSTYFNVAAAMVSIKAKFKTWYHNYIFSQYLQKLEDVISGLSKNTIVVPGKVAMMQAAQTVARKGYISTHDLFSRFSPLMAQGRPVLRSSDQTTTRDLESATFNRLEALLQQLEASTNGSKYETEYVKDLRSSKTCLETVGDGLLQFHVTLPMLSEYHELCKAYASSLYEDLSAAVTLVAGHTGANIFQHWPRVCPMLFLEQLNHLHWQNLPQPWKSCIVKYACSLGSLQHAERMLAVADSAVDLARELQNPGHQNWRPQDHPDSLLMEVESGILIRDVQEQIAGEMRSPPDGRNSVMQLNMGEGKSSVIVPMVAAALADGSQLVRVIVAKPQSKQMAEMLKAKLGGLLGRRVYYLSVSRSLKLDLPAAQAADALARECMVQGGVLLVQPEHLLSFKLMAPECYITGKGDGSVGESLMQTQDFFHSCSRDIVDESDENFSVKFELIYTMGVQGPIEMAPERWDLLQQVLQLTRKLAPQVLAQHPHSVELDSHAVGSFPRLRILSTEAADLLIQLIAGHICSSGLPSLAIIARQPGSVRSAVLTYLTKLELDKTEVDAVHAASNGGFLTDSTKSTLLLLRGLLACGVLRFVFSQKRWRVNYGNASRVPATKLSVPYRAKDSPSTRAEFSHPDVVIALTSLCHYYQGLCDDDLFTALGHLTKSDQAGSEFRAWVEDAPDLPLAFRQIEGINLKDRPQCIIEVFPHLRYAKNVVDYFLGHVVFPKEMKEFPQKLSASGWDIGVAKDRPTTGFSGTNDSRALLPLDVHHLDLQSQKHTNALVLDHLLQPANSVSIMPHIGSTISNDVDRILDTVMSLKPMPEVILDVGAQILDGNRSVARAWLQLFGQEKDAAVYCNDEDELTVVDRQGVTEALQTSPFASRLDRAIIFLDEAHTRGIDLKLPKTYRAAVTLGAGLTKDRLVQACMRLRQLGKGQTVVFLVSEEIKIKIMECTSKPATTSITVPDVLHWSIAEQYNEARRSMPLWAVQGQRFIKQSKIWNEAVKDGATVLSKDEAEKFLEEEAQTVQDRYEPRLDRTNTVLTELDADEDLRSHAIAHRCRKFDELQYNSSTLQEEQERELSPEIEQEREIQRPHPADPALHEVHADIIAFARSGKYSTTSKKYMPAFQALRGTSAAMEFDIDRFGGKKVLASADFARTVKQPSQKKSLASDAYQRPVQWIVSRHASGTIDMLLIISPVEACAVLDHVKNSKCTALHLYKPRCNMAYDPQDALDFYTTPSQVTPLALPRQLAVPLNLFAGQLYLSSYDDYLATCDFLGLSAEAAQDGWEIAGDGFILKDGEGRRGGSSGLSKSPVEFMKVLMSKIRRNGEGISKTHMGRILDGQLLTREDFEGEDTDV
ncbi:unnamed protein product [Zymoseptoria tritici ST99CH_1A5]|uniref:ubiquitinyl hydrolase 1 n=1 Tax=Zymoseptoria tritici ST99CH_1A5 TaxID=1276529 RepID=A0A1Y6LRK0_ZYMTR|nr:unnamed protein product [Zymoseptoria tritici ST99CH_1A5]